jgi:hypothetical protein
MTDATRRPVAVVAGYVVRYPVGGMTWVALNYLLGLRALGFEPVFVEAAGPQPCCYDVAAARMTEDPSYGIAYLERSLTAAGLDDIRWWYRDDGGDRGMTRDEAIAMLESAAVLVDVSGSSWTEEFRRCDRRILVDTDSPFTQIRLVDGDEGWSAFVDAHDVHATYAVNIADGTSAVPRDGRTWVATRPPVHLDAWPLTPVPELGAWTTVTSWLAFGGVWWERQEYRQKDVEYMRIADLPGRVPARLELALGGDAPRRQLAEVGWHVVDPVEVTITPTHFRNYVQSSRGELGVAKHAFIKARTGAFNDRSLDYLASGRPVVCSDTGLDWLPRGEGLLTFHDLDSAAAALREADADIEHHSLAARRLAEEHFAAVEVLADLLRAADVALPVSDAR